jgi:hypothetical protein
MNLEPPLSFALHIQFIDLINASQSRARAPKDQRTFVNLRSMETKLEALLACPDGSCAAKAIRAFPNIAAVTTLLDSLRSSQNDDYYLPQSPPALLLSQALPLSFFNCLAITPMPVPRHSCAEYCSPYESFLLSTIQDVLASSRNTTTYGRLLSFLSECLHPKTFLSVSAIRLCGPIKGRQIAGFQLEGQIAVFQLDGRIALYSASAPTVPTDYVHPSKIRWQIGEWDMAIGEWEIHHYSESPSIFRSLELCQDVKVLPESVYRAIVDCITNPSLQFLSAVIETNVPQIASALATICSYGECHRRAIKFCIYEEASLVTDPGQLMSGSNLRVELPLAFIEQEMFPFTNTHLQPLKAKMNAAPAFDIDSTSDDTIATIRETVTDFASSLLGLAFVAPPCVRFVLRCAFEAVLAFHSDAEVAKRAVIVLFVVRFLLPFLAQARPTDPPELAVDAGVATRLAGLVDVLVLAQSPPERLAPLAESIRPVFEKCVQTVTRAPEQSDRRFIPPWPAIVEAVDVVRTQCAPFARQLTYAPPAAIAFVKAWLAKVANG